MNKLTAWVSGAVVAAALSGIVSVPMLVRPAMAEDHNPRIHHAIDALRDAKHELEEAKHDFHGEKQAAMDAVQNAIDHLDRIKDWDD
jgi:hypothetical protein